ncbi:MAG: GNAT family N-acetyltransferase [Weeksellaceae bacterium]|jgi:predicted GNAT family acetyltransferase|nr:GNAT family N-acetyltransferase [Weeksellaceae bacterium]
MIKTERTDDGKKGEFALYQDDVKAGFMTYVWAGEDKVIIDHTEVFTEFGGRGFGRKLVDAAVEFAREYQLKIIPLCPYAKGVFERTEEIRDVLSD